MQLNSSVIFVFVLIFVGEALLILTEVQAAKSLTSTSRLYQYFPFLALIVVGGAILVFGYVRGITTINNIWIISVASITSILVAEPIINYIIFKKLPSVGVLVGLILGMIGLIVALLF